MARKYDYDMIVIGAGSGGLVVAVGATRLGLSVALVEGHKIGGDCLNYGCVPSKALLEAARTARTIRTAGDQGFEVSGFEVDYEKVKAYVSGVQDKIREHENADYFRRMGMDVIEAYASFVDPHTIEADGRRFTGRYISLATGTRALVPPIEGIEEAGYVTNEGIFTLDEFPKRLCVMGAGPIGAEMAWAYRQLGAEVTVIEMLGSMLTKDDPDMAEIVHRQMADDGVAFHFDSKIVKVEKTGAGKIVTYEHKEGKRGTVTVDELLVAAGRRPNIEKLDLDKAGVKSEKWGIPTDGSQRTNVPHIYAIGDVAGGLLLTHAASLEAATVIRNAVFGLPAKTSYEAFPWCTYTDPELASVGYNETRAKEKGVDYVVTTASFGENDRALAEGRPAGKIKVLLSPPKFLGLGGGKILGAQIVGPHAGELIHEYVVAMKNGLKGSAINAAVHVYPTLSEINKRAISSYLGEKLFQPRTRKWLRILRGFAGRLHPGEDSDKESAGEVKHA